MGGRPSKWRRSDADTLLASGRGLTCRSACAILLIVTIVDMIWRTVLTRQSAMLAASESE